MLDSILGSSRNTTPTPSGGGRTTIFTAAGNESKRERADLVTKVTRACPIACFELGEANVGHATMTAAGTKWAQTGYRMHWNMLAHTSEKTQRRTPRAKPTMLGATNKPT